MQARGSRQYTPAPTHSNTQKQQLIYIHTNILHIHANNKRISYKPVPRGSAPGPHWGYAPRPPILALRAVFKQCKKIKLKKNSTFSAPCRYITAQFKNIRLLCLLSHTWGTPTMPKKCSPPTALGPPAHGMKKFCWGGMPPTMKISGGGGPTRLRACFVTLQAYCQLSVARRYCRFENDVFHV